MGYPVEDLAIEVLSPMYWINEEDGDQLPPARLHLPPGIYLLEGQDDTHVYFAAPGGVGTFLPDASNRRRLSGNRRGGIYLSWGKSARYYRNAVRVEAQDVGAYVDAGEGWVHHLVGCPNFFQAEGKTWRFVNPKQVSGQQPPDATSPRPDTPPPALDTQPLLETLPPARPLLDRPPASPLLDSPPPG